MIHIPIQYQAKTHLDIAIFAENALDKILVGLLLGVNGGCSHLLIPGKDNKNDYFTTCRLGCKNTVSTVLWMQTVAPTQNQQYLHVKSEI